MKRHGGYRKGSGRSRSGYYNGIYCGSTYELCWLIYALDMGMQVRRGSALSDGVITYIPDFIIEESNTIVELKGYEAQDSVDKKTRLAEQLGYKVIVLRKNDLADVFAYVTKKFKTRKYYTLYDSYKPKYTYSCGTCDAVVHREREKKTGVVYCSPKCSMMGNRKLYPRTTETTRAIKNRQKSERYYYEHRDEINKRRRIKYSLSKTAP